MCGLRWTLQHAALAYMQYIVGCASKHMRCIEDGDNMMDCSEFGRQHVAIQYGNPAAHLL